jgi:hypothetical protein
MALTIKRSSNTKSQIRSDMTEHDWLTVTLDNSYPAGGYDADFDSKISGWEITIARITNFGGFTAEWSTSTQKMLVYKGGFEVEVGHNFFDSASGKYPTLFVEVLHVPTFKDDLDIDPTTAIATPPSNVDAAFLGGLTATQFLRNDADDATGVSAPITTTINAGSSLKVDGTMFTGASDNRVVEIATAAITVKNNNTEAVSITPTTLKVAEGASLSVVGMTVKPILRTFTLADGSGPVVTGGSEFNVDGTITPAINNFYGVSGVDGQEITLHCVANGCTINHNPLYLSLQNGEDYVFRVGATIKFKLIDFIWIEQWRQNNDGSIQVGTGGVTAGVGAGTIFVGTGGTINVVGQMTQAIGTQFGASATPTVTGQTFWALDGAVTPSLTNFVGGGEGDLVAIACIGAGSTITPSANIQTQGGVPITPKAGDQHVFKMINGIWVEQPRGNTATGEVGALQVIGPIVQTTPTPLVTNGQDVSTVNRLTVEVGSPLNNVNPITTVTTVKDRQEITITFKQAATMAHATGNIQLAGNVDWSATPNSTTVLVYDSATSTWVEDSSKRHTVV